MDSSECLWASAPVCTQGVCTTCSQDGECADFGAAAPVCNPEFGCVECRADADCAGIADRPHCDKLAAPDPGQGWCRECVADAQCTQAGLTHCYNFTCAECGGDADCAPGEGCRGGVCIDVLANGAACTEDILCAGEVCMRQDREGWAGGMCIQITDSAAACATGSHLVAVDLFYGFNGCFKDCTVAGDCRTDYDCYDHDTSGSTECMPVASGTGVVGAACTSNAQCAGGRNGVCAAYNGYFPGGYCMVVHCGTAGGCPAGSHCAWADAAGTGWCVDPCNAPADCRPGYTCTDVDADQLTECWVE